MQRPPHDMMSIVWQALQSGTFGGVVPLVWRRFDLDPALASGPILTTITDMCGLFFVLSFTTML
jgi:magnesium transporter